MPLTRRLAADIVATLRDGKTLRLRAGTRHRFIGIWVVVASFNSRTYATTTRSPSATTATTFVFILAGIGTAFTLRTSVKYFTTPSRPDAALGLCWM